MLDTYEGLESVQCLQDGLFFQITDETVACARRYEVGDEESIEEDALRPKDHGTHEQTGFIHLQKREKVHALVVRLLE